MSKYPRYPEYKESGVEWLGEIPSKWKVTPIKHLGFLKGGAGFPHSKQGVQGEILDFHKVNALGSADPHGCLVNSKNTISAATASELGAHVFPPYSIVFAKVGAALLLGRIRQLKKAACIDNNMMGLVVREQHDTDFIKYVMHLVRFDYIVNPGAVPSLNEFTMGNSLLVTPSREEQRAIVSFLDHETAKIDTLIEKQQQLIKLLKEKRQAVISHAVTKGLNPDASMKDSGVEWLGEVPKSWRVAKLRYLIIESVAGPYGASLTKAMYTTSGYRVYGQQQVIADSFSLGDYYISESKYSEMRRYTVHPNDVLITVMGTIGRVAVVPKGIETGIINPRLVRYVFDQSRIFPEFVKLQISSLLHQDYLLKAAQGSTMDGLNMSILGGLPLVYPDLKEQEAILSYIENRSQKYSKLIESSEKSLDLLQERRTALISAAVTGKIDVRNWQPENQPAQANAS